MLSRHRIQIPGSKMFFFVEKYLVYLTVFGICLLSADLFPRYRYISIPSQPVSAAKSSHPKKSKSKKKKQAPNFRSADEFPSLGAAASSSKKKKGRPGKKALTTSTPKLRPPPNDSKEKDGSCKGSAKTQNDGLQTMSDFFSESTLARTKTKASDSERRAAENSGGDNSKKKTFDTSKSKKDAEIDRAKANLRRKIQELENDRRKAFAQGRAADAKKRNAKTGKSVVSRIMAELDGSSSTSEDDEQAFFISRKKPVSGQTSDEAPKRNRGARADTPDPRFESEAESAAAAAAGAGAGLAGGSASGDGRSRFIGAEEEESLLSYQDLLDTVDLRKSSGESRKSGGGTKRVSGKKKELSVKEKPEPKEKMLVPAKPKTKTCQVCFEDVFLSRFPTITIKCTHDAIHCITCIQHYIREQTQGKVPDKIECMTCLANQVKPRVVLEHADVKRLAEKTVFERYDSVLARRAMGVSDTFRWCSNPDCSNGIEFLDQQRYEFFRCSACRWRTCFKHQVPWDHGLHKGLTCNQYEKTKDKTNDEMCEAWKKAETKKCPKCKIDIQKNGGCIHMTCNRKAGGCGHDFCWHCGADWIAGTNMYGSNHRHRPDCQFYIPPPRPPTPGAGAAVDAGVNANAGANNGAAAAAAAADNGADEALDAAVAHDEQMCCFFEIWAILWARITGRRRPRQRAVERAPLLGADDLDIDDELEGNVAGNAGNAGAGEEAEEPRGFFAGLRRRRLDTPDPRGAGIAT